MIIFKTAAPLITYIRQQKQALKKIGFVPTMGALHAGHLSLIQHSLQQAPITVCSIFVNPTQFTNADDFEHYPVTIERDIEQLLKVDCTVLFMPGIPEIYPEDYKRKLYELGSIETTLEGYYRPGHFQGVCQVMDRLLHLIDPDLLFMGQKDYQQCMVVKQLLRSIHKENSIQFIMEPTLREKDGLAMSSRNLRLSEEERKTAPAIYQQLSHIKQYICSLPFLQLEEEARNNLEHKGFAVDYVQIRDVETLTPAVSTSQKLVALVAATLGKIRLIDNLLLN